MRISTYLMGIIILGLIFNLFYGMASELTRPDVYGGTLNQTYLEDFDKLSESTRQIEEDYQAVSNWSVDTSSFLGLTSNAASLAKNAIFQPINITQTLIQNTSSNFKLQGWLQIGVYSLIIIGLLFGLIALIKSYRWT